MGIEIIIIDQTMGGVACHQSDQMEERATDVETAIICAISEKCAVNLMKSAQCKSQEESGARLGQACERGVSFYYFLFLNVKSGANER